MTERDRLLAGLIAMCFVAGMIALALHPRNPFGSIAQEQGSLKAPPGIEDLHESAGDGDVPPEIALAGPDAGTTGGNGEGGASGPSSPPPDKPVPPNEPPPPDRDLLSQVLSDLPELPPPPLTALSRAGKDGS